MYNLEVAQDHTFTAGDGNWVVHNLPCAGFINPQKLLGHFTKHNGEFSPPFVSAEHYQAAGMRFMSREIAGGVLQGRFIAGRFTGDIIRYNTITNEFGMVSSEGVLRSYYLPNRDH